MVAKKKNDTFVARMVRSRDLIRNFRSFSREDVTQ